MQSQWCAEVAPSSSVGENVAIHGLGISELDEIAAIHGAAFPHSLLSELGTRAVKHYYRWQMRCPEGAAVLGARADGVLRGYCFLTYRRLGARYVRRHWLYLLLRMLLRPGVLLGAPIWGRRALELLLGGNCQEPAPPEIRMLALAVDPAQQRRGIGRRLADAAEQMAAASGVTRMGLSVHPENHKAVAFYERTGWRPVPRNGIWNGEMSKTVEGGLPAGAIREAFHFEAERVRREFVRRDSECSPGLYDPLQPFSHHLQRQVDDALRRGLLELGGSPVSRFRILDLGCGSGSALLRMVSWGADPASCAGIDLDTSRIEIARNRLPASDFRIGDAVTLPWPDASFDLILQSTVFTSLRANAVRRRIAGEMLRVLKPGGVICWHDLRMNNPSNPQVRGIGVAELRGLFPGCRIEVRRTVIAPPIGRRIYGRLPLMVEWLEKLPFLCTHLTGIVRRDGAAGGGALTMEKTL